MTSKSTVIAIVVILAVIIVGWIIYSMSQGKQMYNNADTTGSISNDLNQVPDDSALDGDIDSLNKEIQNF